VTLSPILSDARRPEADLDAEYQAIQPLILGALYNSVAQALLDVDRVRPTALPRLADLAVWVTAAEPDHKRGTFIRVLTGARQAEALETLTEDPVGAAILALVEKAGGWEGTATELLTVLATRADEETRRSQRWPKRPDRLSALIRRLAPALRQVGMEVTFARTSSGRRRVLSFRKTADFSVTSVTQASRASPEASPGVTKVTLNERSDAHDAKISHFSESSQENAAPPPPDVPTCWRCGRPLALGQQGECYHCSVRAYQVRGLPVPDWLQRLAEREAEEETQ